MVCGAALFPVACSSAESAEDKTEGAVASAHAKFYTFEWKGELVTDKPVADGSEVAMGQLLFAVGQLNGENSAPQLAQAEVQTTVIPNGATTKVQYTAKVPVAWGVNKSPEGYELILPREMSESGIKKVIEKYGNARGNDSCVDVYAHDVDASSIWYYYRPQTAGCGLEETEIVRAKVTAKEVVASQNKFPEYDRVWSDDTLQAVLIFGQYEERLGAGPAGLGEPGTKPEDDPGVKEHNRFINALRSRLKDTATTANYDDVAPGTGEVSITTTWKRKQIAYATTLANGKKANITIFLTSVLRGENADFDAAYQEVQRRADFIAYNGHAGLGANVRSLIDRTEFRGGQYTLMVINGCDTYAYLDETLMKKVSKANGGAKSSEFLDIVSNAMPSYVNQNTRTTMGFLEPLLDYGQSGKSAAKSYTEILSKMDPEQVATVIGEEDNAFSR